MIPVRLNEAWIDLDRLGRRDDRLVRIVLRREGVSQVAVCIRMPRIELDRPAIGADRVGGTTSGHQGRAKIDVHRGYEGLQRNRPLALDDGFLGPARIEQCVA